MLLDKCQGGSVCQNTPCPTHFWSSKISNFFFLPVLWSTPFLINNNAFLPKSVNVGFYCLQFRTLIHISCKERVKELWVFGLKQGSLKELLFIYRYLKGCRVEEKQTASVWLQKAKLDQWEKLWGEIFQLNTKPSKIALRNMMPRDEVSLRWVTARVSGVWTLCQGCCIERIYFLKVSLLLRYISIFIGLARISFAFFHKMVLIALSSL